ncbi:MAG: PD-(D/E)XK nuclease family protein [Burkholderiales bacterium]
MTATETLGLPSDRLLAGAADVLVARRGTARDLSGVVVLLPSLHAVPAMAAALATAAGGALLLPRITTLAAWAATMDAGKPLLAATAREAAVYQALHERGWFAEADLWAVAGELGGLFDELTRWRVPLPDALAAFTQQLQKAYKAKAGTSLSFEARVVHELWRALDATRGALDPEAAYAVRLSALARTACAPLHVVALDRPTPAEAEFFARYAERAHVTQYVAAMDDEAPLARMLAAAWPASLEVPLAARAMALRVVVSASPLDGRLRVCGAASAETEAQMVDVAVREWLLAGKQSIAVIVQDRVVARRARALLERAQVLVKDEAGWAFSTTSAATAVGRLLDVVSSGAYYRDLLDLMKSPFAFADVPREARQAAVARFERAVREHGQVADLDAFLALSDRMQDAEVRALLERVANATREFTRRSRTLAGWLEALGRALAAIGITGGFEADAAGAQLLELLDDLARELAEDRLAVSLADWRRWLARKFERATFRDRAIDSPVIFTTLAAARLRPFDGAILVGGDALHLPGPDTGGLFFNQGVRAELGLPTRAEVLAELQTELGALLVTAGETVVTWQARADGEPNLLSPFLQRLTTLHALAWGGDLADDTLATRLSGATVAAFDAAPLPAPIRQPFPSAAPALVPEKISASGYNTLMACPYQFHARYLLGLGEADEVKEEIDKSAYGQAVHAVLARFHGQHPVVSALAPDEAVNLLTRYSDQAFREAIAANPLDAAWLARWKGLIPAYIEWQLAREREGWRFAAGEAARAIAIETPGGRTFTLRGRLDRVDRREDTGTINVIDYKLRRRALLEKGLKARGEDVQLPVYALLWAEPVAAGLYLSIEREGVEEVAAADDLAALAVETRDRLAAVYDALHDEVALPAQGTAAACEYCEMRGLCRRGQWA